MRRLALLLLWPSLALGAGGIEGTVTALPPPGGGEATVKNALVFVEGYSEGPASREPKTMRQNGRQFFPTVLAVEKGGAVRFSNDEPAGVWHHVFSPGPGRKFDEGHFRAGMVKREDFNDLGRHDIFCDIHREMYATVWVVPNRAHVVMESADGASGKFELHDVRPGKWTLVVWHRGAGDEPVRVPVEVNDGQTTHVDVTLHAKLSGAAALLAPDHKPLTGGAYSDDRVKAMTDEAEKSWR